jgi:hypothetical protein
MMIAEGSDWFWWYGDDHSTAFAAEFDTLFRENVANVYHSLGDEPPDSLLEPIKSVSERREIVPPLRQVTPVLDGRVSTYPEWINAGTYDILGGAGMQHQTSTLISKLFFGFDSDNFYLRADGREPFNAKPLDGLVLRVYITAPVRAEVEFDFESGAPPLLKLEGEEQGRSLQYGYNRILEFAVPLETLCRSEDMAFSVAVECSGNELERHPQGRRIELHRLGDDLDSQVWTV